MQRRPNRRTLMSPFTAALAWFAYFAAFVFTFGVVPGLLKKTS